MPSRSGRSKWSNPNSLLREISSKEMMAELKSSSHQRQKVASSMVSISKVPNGPSKDSALRIRPERISTSNSQFFTLLLYQLLSKLIETQELVQRMTKQPLRRHTTIAHSTRSPSVMTSTSSPRFISGQNQHSPLTPRKVVVEVMLVA